MNLRGIKRIVALAMMCCITVLACANPAFAVSSYGSLALDLIPEVPVTDTEPQTVADEMVSIVRYGPYYSGTVIGCLENGTKVEILGTSGDFYKIDCYDMNGYIAKSQVAVNETGESYVSCVEDSSETTWLPGLTMTEALELRSEILAKGKTYLGVPYVWGGSSPSGFDCSGFVQYTFKKCGVSLNRSAITQLQNGVVIPREDLQCGDLVFFSNTGGRGFASHVGIYIGNGLFIHSGSSTGVTITSLDNSYFAVRFQCARRVLLSDTAVSAAVPDVGVLSESSESYWRNSGWDTGLGGY